MSAGSAGFLFAQAPDSRASRLVGLFFLCAAWWSGCELAWNSAPDADAALIWMKVSALGWLGVSVLLPHSVLSTMDAIEGKAPARWRRLLGRVVAVEYAGTIAIGALVWLNDPVFGEPYRVLWGWSYTPGPGLAVTYGLALIAIVCSFRGLQYLFQGLSVAESAQRPWVWLGIAAPTLAIPITDVMLPLLGVEFPRLGSSAFALTGGLAVWQAIRHGHSLISPTRFSDEILEVLDEGVALVTVDGKIRRANGGLAEISGYTSAELLGMRLTDLVERDPHASAEIGDLRRDLWRRSGEKIPVAMSTRQLRDRAQKSVGVVVVMRDLRELEELRRSVITNARLAAVGELAAGIAHEINNPVAFVGSNLRVLREHWTRLSAGAARELEPVVADGSALIEESLEGVERAAEIVAGVKRFTHAGTAQRQRVDLSELIDEIVSMARPQIAPEIRVERDYGELPKIECSPQELKQVFLNLLINAVHAVRPSGCVRIRTRLDAELAVVSFEDDGCGIAPDVIDRIFDPFFTTKEVGEGTGLGLGISHQIVSMHKGVITVHSEFGVGTTFRVHLPI